MLVVTITAFNSPSVDDETAERETTLGILGAHYRTEDLEHRHFQGPALSSLLFYFSKCRWLSTWYFQDMLNARLLYPLSTIYVYH